MEDHPLIAKAQIMVKAGEEKLAEIFTKKWWRDGINAHIDDVLPEKTDRDFMKSSVDANIRMLMRDQASLFALRIFSPSKYMRAMADQLLDCRKDIKDEIERHALSVKLEQMEKKIRRRTTIESLETQKKLIEIQYLMVGNGTDALQDMEDINQIYNTREGYTREYLRVNYSQESPPFDKEGKEFKLKIYEDEAEIFDITLVPLAVQQREATPSQPVEAEAEAAATAGDASSPAAAESDRRLDSSAPERRITKITQGGNVLISQPGDKYYLSPGGPGGGQVTEQELFIYFVGINTGKTYTAKFFQPVSEKNAVMEGECTVISEKDEAEPEPEPKQDPRIRTHPHPLHPLGMEGGGDRRVSNLIMDKMATQLKNIDGQIYNLIKKEREEEIEEKKKEAIAKEKLEEEIEERKKEAIVQASSERDTVAEEEKKS